MQREREVALKLERLRALLGETRVVRLRRSDWFSWATAGGSNVVLLSSETGIAEIFVSAESAWVLTDEIEARRMSDEELTKNFEIHAVPWSNADQREELVRSLSRGREVLSDRPYGGESLLPQEILALKLELADSEIERYRTVGKLAAEAMTEVLSAAQCDWSEHELAGAGAAALWSRGLHPALTLAAGERRLPLYRHPTAGNSKLGRVAMLVFCARGNGLFANLTRFVAFAPLAQNIVASHASVAEIEAEALEQSQVGNSLAQVYETLARAYRDHGHERAIREHHQGGLTGYQAREVVATSATRQSLRQRMAVAWNPSVTGAKIEDTFLVTANGLDPLTFDPNWPHRHVRGYERPLVLEK
jgi:Xaa-Pro aminopeptidase